MNQQGLIKIFRILDASDGDVLSTWPCGIFGIFAAQLGSVSATNNACTTELRENYDSVTLPKPSKTQTKLQKVSRIASVETLQFNSNSKKIRKHPVKGVVVDSCDTFDIS